MKECGKLAREEKEKRVGESMHVNEIVTLCLYYCSLLAMPSKVLAIATYSYMHCQNHKYHEGRHSTGATLNTPREDNLMRSERSLNIRHVWHVQHSEQI